MKVEFFKHNLGDEEIKSAERVLRSFFLTTGEEVEKFEKALAEYLGVKYAVGLTSCTGGLHLALLAAGVGPGDEVITTPMSFVATANSVLMAGATPVFVDVEPETGNLNADLIEKAVTPKTKAILPVHLYGQMADMKKILAIAEKHNLAVIEDAAHALEAERDGIRPGQKSFGACFSFYATKAITSGEGGAFATNDENIAKLVRQLRSHGITAELTQRQRSGLKTYDIDRLGWKYNMDNIQAALLNPQIRKTGIYREQREAVASRYQKGLSGLPITMPKAVGIHARHLFSIWVLPEKRDAVLEHLNKSGIGAVINYPPIHLFSFYRQKFGLKEGMFPVAEEIGRCAISLPMYAKLTDEEINYVIQQVSDAVKN